MEAIRYINTLNKNKEELVKAHKANRVNIKKRLEEIKYHIINNKRLLE